MTHDSLSSVLISSCHDGESLGEAGVSLSMTVTCRLLTVSPWIIRASNNELCFVMVRFFFLSSSVPLLSSQSYRDLVLCLMSWCRALWELVSVSGRRYIGARPNWAIHIRFMKPFDNIFHLFIYLFTYLCWYPLKNNSASSCYGSMVIFFLMPVCPKGHLFSGHFPPTPTHRCLFCA